VSDGPRKGLDGPTDPKVLRVLLVTPEPPSADARGGRPQATFAALAGLSMRHRVTLVVQAGGDPSDEDALEQWRAAGVEVHAIWWQTPRGKEMWERRLLRASSWLSSGYPWRNILHRDILVQRTLDRVLAEDRFDIVLAEDNVMGMYEYRTLSPKILTEHEVRRPRAVEWRHWLKRPSLRGALGDVDWQRWSGYQRGVWHRFERIQCFTTQDAAIARIVAPDVANRVRVNPFGIELPRPLDTASEQPDTLVFVGALSHAPNVDATMWLANEIMPSMRRLRPGVRLTIVGHSPPASVRRLATDDIVVTGGVSEIKPYLEGAAIVVAPVRIGGGMRTKVVQAMAYGKAVVTTDRGTHGLDLAGEVPPIAVANDASEFAAMCASLLANTPLRRDLGLRAREFVAKHHSPAAYANRLEKIISELVSIGRETVR
jgi:polysaccharide biosynthesis protein PslH